MPTLRIAVRKFTPFEKAIEQQWADFKLSLGTIDDWSMEYDALELNKLHAACFDAGTLADGSYDVAFVVTDALADAVDRGLLLDLSQDLRENPPADYPNGWSDSLLGLQSVNGAVYGLPYHDGPECLIYRSDLIEKPPATWAEFLATSRRLADPAHEQFGTVVAAFADGHNTVYDFCLHLWTRCGDLLTNGRPSLDTDASREALRFYRTLVRDDATVPGARAIHSVPAGELFMQGRVAMMVNWFGFAAAAMTLEASDVRGNVAIAPVPRGMNGRHASLNVYWLLAVASGSKHADLAYRFIRHCASPPMDKVLTQLGGVGTRRSTWGDAEVNAAVPFFGKLDELHAGAKSFPVDRRTPALLAAIEAAVLRTLDTDDAIEAITVDLQRDAMLAWGGA